MLVHSYQRLALLRRQVEAFGVAAGISKKGGAACPVMGEAVQGNGQFDATRLISGTVILRRNPGCPTVKLLIVIVVNLSGDAIKAAMAVVAGSER